MITDLSKYKRLFAFGCSFTQYFYPTWADIIYKSMKPDVTFHNFGKAGGGNLFIAHRITEANRRFKFNKDDLIIVMWSTFARIDFYSSERGHWITPGNIFTQDMISEPTVRELADLNWFLMRDLSVIDLADTYLDSLGCDSIKFMSVPFDYEIIHQNREADDIEKSICELYDDIKQRYPKTLFEHMNFKWSSSIKYYDPHHGENFIDYHPTPTDYLAYLQKHNVPINQTGIEYAENAARVLLTPGKSKQDFCDIFADCDERVSSVYRTMW